MGAHEPIVELIPEGPRAVQVPHVPVRVPHVIGPGRRERAYLTRLDNLQERLDSTAEQRDQAERELDTSVRLERGCQRLIDRMETGWSEDRERLDQAQGQRARLVLALGGLQRENELLRERLELAAPPTARLESGQHAAGPISAPSTGSARPQPRERSGLFARWFRRASASSAARKSRR